MILESIDFSPLWISVKTGLAASVVSFFLGIAAAEVVVGRKGKVIKQ